jgi:hypothetical protein
VKATDEQILAALKLHDGSRTKASQFLGITPRAFATRVSKLKDKGAAVPESQYNAPTVTGTSTLYGADGETRLTWVKTQADKPTPETVAAAVREALLGIEPFKVIPAPKVTLAHLLTVYPIGDAHIGMYAWGEEAGADYDLKIAERLHLSAMSHLVAASPASAEALIVDVGDHEHYDNIKGETTKSGNRLDMDSRYQAMLRVSLKVSCGMIDEALKKHQHVTVFIVPGNHNDILAAARQEALALVYRNNPRVKIIAKAGKFFYHAFGKVLIGMTHGDTGKPEKLAGVMAVDEPQMWGRSLFRYWYTGHVHNKSQMEVMGTTWETFRTLAPTDAWAHGAGYRGGRDMMSIVHHREHGEVCRHTFNPSMLAAA